MVWSATVQNIVVFRLVWCSLGKWHDESPNYTVQPRVRLSTRQFRLHFLSPVAPRKAVYQQKKWRAAVPFGKQTTRTLCHGLHVCPSGHLHLVCAPSGGLVRARPDTSHITSVDAPTTITREGSSVPRLGYKVCLLSADTPRNADIC